MLLMNSMITVLPEWLTAIGTVCAVLVALFGGAIKKWINRPKIAISIDNNSPYIEEFTMGTTDNSIDEKRLVLRVCITNSGKYTADYAVLNVDEYYHKHGADSDFLRKMFTPKQFKDCNNAKLSVIAPNLKYYVNIATIQRYKGMTSADEKGESKQFYKLYLLGDGENKQLGTGCFVIPLKFYSSRTNVIIAYLKILWDSDNFTRDKDFFDVKIISEKEFKQLSKRK